MNLGVAFQIMDDILDYVGDETKMGKPAGTDLKEGHLTLPSLLAIKEDETIGGALRKLVKEDTPSPEAVRECVAMVVDSGAIEKSRAMAEYYGMEALQHLGCLSNSPYSEALRDMVSKVLDRDA